jgi:hypothetical protein
VGLGERVRGRDALGHVQLGPFDRRLVAVDRGEVAVACRGGAVLGGGGAVGRRAGAVGSSGPVLVVTRPHLREDLVDEGRDGGAVERGEPSLLGGVVAQLRQCRRGEVLPRGRVDVGVLDPPQAFDDLPADVPEPVTELAAVGAGGHVPVLGVLVAGLGRAVASGRGEVTLIGGVVPIGRRVVPALGGSGGTGRRAAAVHASAPP